MPDQIAKHITDIVIGLCATKGLPRIIHSDEGCNFYAILHQTVQAFGVTKTHTSAYHPQGDGMFEQLNSSDATCVCDKGDQLGTVSSPNHVCLPNHSLLVYTSITI